MRRPWSSCTGPTPNGGPPFDAAVSELIWAEPSPRLRLLWEGSRALGLHPFHPDAQRLAPHQLWWAIVQGREDKGLDPRTKHQENVAEANSKAVGELVAWADQHISRS